MPKLNIDLGVDPKSSHSCAPCACSEADEPYYPSFYYDGKKKLDLPDEGEMTIRFKKTSSSQSEDKHGKRYSCTIQVREIVSAYGKDGEDMEAPSKRNREAEDALDALMKEKKEKSEKEDY